MPLVEDDLRRLGDNDYRNALSRIRRLPSVVTGGVSVVQFGAVQHPGISDLDILLSGAGTSLVEVQRDIQALVETDADLRYMLWHPPLYVPDEIQECAVALHTLRGVVGSETLDGVAPRTVIQASDRAQASREVVPWAWFLFLLPIAERLFTRQCVSLRMILLVHKNLVESENMALGTDDWSAVEEVREAAQKGRTADVFDRLDLALSGARDGWNARVGAALGLRPTQRAVRTGGKIFCSDTSPLRWVQRTRVAAVLRPMELAFLECLTASSDASCKTTGEQFACYRAFHNRSSKVLASLNLHNGFVVPFGLKF